MDILSHGLWGGITFGRKNRRNYWWAFFFGISPDLFSFGIFMAMRVLGLVSGPDWSSGPPPMEKIPAYVRLLYNPTHSLIVFAAIFFLVWLLLKKPFLPMLAWGLHILFDIPTHSAEFFPTPFLWPLSGLQVDGVPWSHPVIFIPNIVFLAGLYSWYFLVRRRKQKTNNYRQ